MNAHIETLADDIEINQPLPPQSPLIELLTDAQLQLVGGGGGGAVDWG